MRPRLFEDLYTQEYEELLKKGTDRTKTEAKRWAELRRDIQKEIRRRRSVAAKEREAIEGPPGPPQKVAEPPITEDRSFPGVDSGNGGPESADARGDVASQSDVAPQTRTQVTPPPIDDINQRREMFRMFVSSQLMILGDWVKRLGEEPPPETTVAMLTELWTLAAEANGWLQGDMNPRLVLIAAGTATGACYGLPILAVYRKAKERKGGVS